METPLKPCPFCGGEASVIVDMIQCRACGALGPYTRDQIRGGPPATEKWNARHHMGGVFRRVHRSGDKFWTVSERIAILLADLEHFRARAGGDTHVSLKYEEMNACIEHAKALAWASVGTNIEATTFAPRFSEEERAALGVVLRWMTLDEDGHLLKSPPAEAQTIRALSGDGEKEPKE